MELSKQLKMLQDDLSFIFIFISFFNVCMCSCDTYKKKKYHFEEILKYYIDSTFLSFKGKTMDLDYLLSKGINHFYLKVLFPRY